jgi:hypothetical protein
MPVPRPSAPRADLTWQQAAPESGVRGQFSFDSNEGGFFEIGAFSDNLRQLLFDTLGAMQLRQKRSARGEIRRKR